LIKGCKDDCAAATIALELSQSSICYFKDLWSKEKIEFIIYPEPQTINSSALEEIVFCYVFRPFLDFVVSSAFLVPLDSLSTSKS
jgi:hypothetical protein